ncbi:MAG TPA: hypothetical protein VIK86_06895 [Candidatus Paceibacterota bacterium]
MNLKLDITNIKIDVSVDINIKLGNNALDGGVYMFLLDDVPLYIGETNIFLSRLAVHLGELKKDCSYFGLKDLKDLHELKFIILDNQYPYNPYKDTENSRKTDLNKPDRKNLERRYINAYHPLTQKPKFLNNIEIQKMRMVDHMLPINEKNKIVYDGINSCIDEYNDIISKIKAKDYIGKFSNDNCYKAE